MSDVIDLDALVPQPVTIKFDNQEIQLAPPKVGDVLRLGSLAQKIQDIDDVTDGQMETLVNDLTAQVQKCVPELAGKPLTSGQLLKLVEIISRMAIPPDVQALEAKGVTVGDPKAPSE